MLEPLKFLSRHPRVTAAFVVLTIFIALNVGGAQSFAVNMIPSPWDKFVHCAVFSIVGAAFAVIANARRWPLVLAAATAATLLGAYDEWHQLSLAGRNAGWGDLVADATGALAGAWLTATHLRG